ncbi:DUF6701 domain-containing protein [Shewanella glacialipiscicola]|uniref:DUF6701 domain-containing protein n=1 Tax=Shewanella glacialipiscicola TaxID=614069 RepID=UPI003D7B0C7E
MVRFITVCCILLFSCSIQAFENIDYGKYFPAVVQGHHGTANGCANPASNLTIYKGFIDGTNGQNLAYCSSNKSSNSMSNNVCDDGAGGTRYCDITGQDIAGLDLTAATNLFQTSSGTTGISYGECQANAILGADNTTEFGSVVLDKNSCNLTFSSSHQTYKIKNLILDASTVLNLSAGDYWVENFTITGGTPVINTAGNVRFFVKNPINISGALKFNPNRAGELLFFGYSNIALNTSNIVINGYIYSDADVIVNGRNTIIGRITSRKLTINEDTEIVNGVSLQLNYGKATTASVTFERAFPTGVKPLVFLMPTISTANTNNDVPSSTFITSISSTGFTWRQAQPSGTNNPASNMQEVHWIAVTPGNYTLSDGTPLRAGSININSAFGMNNNGWANISLDNNYSVVLNQIQTNNNNCWLTSVTEPASRGLKINMDVSQVYKKSNSPQCQPANIKDLVNESVAYLALPIAKGIINLNGADVRYQFGTAMTHSGGGSTKTLAEQCAYNTGLIGFTNPPTLVAGKNSHNGSDGGWLRRCNLSATQVSMVNDEDTYQSNDRSHASENYGFVAFEKAAPVLQCFNDQFSQSPLSSDWVVSTSSGTFTPSIVGNRLRLTEAKSNQSTASTYQRLFPAANNLVEIQFDHYAYGGNGADGMSVVLSDAAITPQPGAFGGPLGYGYKPGISGFAGGWLGVGIDEYGNFSGEGGSTNIGQRRQSVAVRGSGVGTSGYRYLRGTCSNGTTNTGSNCLSPAVDGNNVSPAHRYKITIDSQLSSQSVVKIERNTGSGFVTLIPAFNAVAESGQAAVPSDFLLSLTGSTGGSNNNHEIDNVQICALKSNPIGAQIDHFEFDHTGQGLTCNTQTVTIRACANANCSQLFTEPLSATLLPDSINDGVWVGGNQVSFSGGTTQLQLRRNTPGVVTLGVKGSNPTTKPLSKTLCRIGSGELSGSNCSLAFADSGFIFDVPDKLANKPVDVLVKAVKKSDVTQQCIPSFQDKTKSLSFWSDYVEPSAPILSKAITVNGASISGVSSAPTPFSLTFDTKGEATISVNYPDAGKLQLDAKYTGTGDEQGLVMAGADPFVSVPAGLCIKPVDANASCASASMACNVYRKAGQSFGMTVQAMAWERDSDTDFCTGNLSTPNFSDKTMTLASKVVAPAIAIGGRDGALGVASYSHIANSTNINTILNQTISEVGVFQLTAKASSNYLGAASSLNIPLGYSANIGRFVPDRFLVSEAFVSPACDSFSYMDQSFPMSMTLSALNIAGDITQNYFAPFSFATAKLVGENINNGIDLQSRLSTLPIISTSWIKGVASLDNSYRANFSRVTPNVLTNLYQDGPFELLDIGVQVLDNDPHPNGINSYVASPDMDAATTGNCANCTAKKITTQKLRHGRVVMDNTYGPETEILRMPTRAEYWNGSSWVLNSDDSCTVVNASLASQTDDINLGYSFEPDLVAGQSIERSGSMPKFQAGQFDLIWRAVTTSGALYRGQVTAPLDVPSWLEWYWNWNDITPTITVDPRASAYFGRYRGHDRIIYWREVD